MVSGTFANRGFIIVADTGTERSLQLQRLRTPIPPSGQTRDSVHRVLCDAFQHPVSHAYFDPYTDGYFHCQCDANQYAVANCHLTRTPTTLTITSDNPDPSEINQSVSVSVIVSGGSPTGIVDIGGADTNCQITLNNGTGSCTVIFTTTGMKTLTAFYPGDAAHFPSSDVEKSRSCVRSTYVHGDSYRDAYANQSAYQHIHVDTYADKYIHANSYSNFHGHRDCNAYSFTDFYSHLHEWFSHHCCARQFQPH